jgi:hypothetical protein
MNGLPSSSAERQPEQRPDQQQQAHHLGDRVNRKPSEPVNRLETRRDRHRSNLSEPAVDG